MQQLSVVHKKTTNNNNSIVVSETKKQQEEIGVENKRESHGLNIDLTRKVFCLENSDTFYVESESCDNIYYCVRYNPSVFEWCSCPDNSYRGNTCKHIFGIIEGIKKNKIVDVSALPPM